jgi:transcriptional regulator with XRE-family HTH domain
MAQLDNKRRVGIMGLLKDKLMRSHCDDKVGERIADRRRELGLSQRNIAASPGFGYPYVSRIEAGNRTPSLQKLIAVSLLLGMNPLYTQFGHEPKELQFDQLPHYLPLIGVPPNCQAETIAQLKKLYE